MSSPRERRRHALSILLCLLLGALLVLGGVRTVGSSTGLGLVFIAVGAGFLMGGAALVRHSRRLDRD